MDNKSTQRKEYFKTYYKNNMKQSLLKKKLLKLNHKKQLLLLDMQNLDDKIDTIQREIDQVVENDNDDNNNNSDDNKIPNDILVNDQIIEIKNIYSQ